MKRLATIIFFLATSLAFANEPSTQIKYNGSSNYNLVERTNLRRYDNGKYTGLLSREVRSFISRTSNPSDQKGFWFEGSFYVTEHTVHNQRIAYSGIHDSILSSFCINPDGSMKMGEDNGFPSFRGFPSYSKEKIVIGSVWKGEGVRAFDPLNKGIVTRMPMLVQYVYEGTEDHNGEEVYKISAQWATRYGKFYFDYDGDPDLLSANGSHKATILVSVETGAAILIRDNVDEVFTYKDGSSVAFKGTIILFTEYPPAVPKDDVIHALQRVAIATPVEITTPVSNPKINKDDTSSQSANKKNNTKPNTKENNSKSDSKTKKPTIPESTKESTDSSPLNKLYSESAGKLPANQTIKYEETDSGIKLTLEDIQFAPNTANLLPGEGERIKKIAEILKQAPLSQFLIVGHTANVGNPKEEQTLSEQRAHMVAEKLASYGIDANKFICRGSGARSPIADNSTSEGKARNRRVEITILE